MKVEVYAMKDYIPALVAIALFILVIAISLGITMALVYGACWCFGLTYSHKIAVGVWFILCLVRSTMKGGKHE